MKRFFLGRVKRADRQRLSTAALVIAIIVTALGTFTTYVYIHIVDTQYRRDYALAERQQLQNAEAYIQNKFIAYEQILLAGATAAYIKGDDAINRADWSTYYQTNGIKAKFPGILALGYARYITNDQKSTHFAQMQADGFTDFQIIPAGERNFYVPVTFIEPYNSNNQATVGYDMFSEQARRTAIAKATDSGSTTLTAPIDFFKQSPRTDQASKNGILYYPVYAGGRDPKAQDARRLSIRGFVYIAFYVSDMLQPYASESEAKGVSYTIDDVTDGKPQRLFSSEKSSAISGNMVSDTLRVNSRVWRLSMHVPQTIVSGQVHPLRLFFGGLGISILLGSFAFLLLKIRIDKLTKSHNSELQNTRDELLALASHQLRTPATGVKQYIGMLREGYFGNQTPEQLSIINKAYASNDRQLEIIDQLLYVAKADAGQLSLKPERFTLSATVLDVAEAMREQAKPKEISFQLRVPPNVTIIGDERFIRMIIENLVSNAIKYSYPNSTVQITLQEKLGTIRLRVSDSGTGIASEDLGRLFKKFSRIENPLSSKEAGSGLGLYLAQMLAVAHGGKITTKQRRPRGTEFILILPKHMISDETVIQLTEHNYTGNV
ncbi:CHASE domain-containing protein [Candidatus Saccharibacteria bacterium]|nr:MAG: CHASE domain-containing protein [Candidatus Saccharibacteria bacterium]